MNPEAEVPFALLVGALCAIGLFVQWLCGRAAEARRRRRRAEEARTWKECADARVLAALQDAPPSIDNRTRKVV